MQWFWYYSYYSISSIQMQTRISKSFLIEEGDHILREALVEKKSKWLKFWNKRKMILFSNKLTFLEEAQTKPKDRNVIYLGSIIEIGDYGQSNNLMKIITDSGNFEIKLTSLGQKQSWIDDIKQASRTLKIIKSQTPSPKHFHRNMCPNRIFCIGF